MFKPGLGILIAIVIAAGLYAVATRAINPRNEEGTVCTMEAKQCPDGSYVGRSGPNCEFAPCPGSTSSTPGTPPTGGTPSLNTKYIRALDWPPKLQVVSEAFSCTPAGSPSDRAGGTQKKVINGHTYCVTQVTGAAAGSVYDEYAYAFPKDGKTAILTFTLQSPQCANYDDPKRTECEKERSSFSIDPIIDSIAQSVSVSSAPVSNGSSGVKGTVTLGPTCPVMRNPPDPTCADKPYQASFYVTKETSSTVLKEFSSNSSGDFSVSLPPGTYVIHQSSKSMLPRCSDVTVDVHTNLYEEVGIYCDTGIR